METIESALPSGDTGCPFTPTNLTGHPAFARCSHSARLLPINQAFLLALALCTTGPALAAQPADFHSLDRAREILVNIPPESPPQRFIIHELDGNQQPLETLEVQPPREEGDEALYFLNGRPIDPEVDSLGRFQNFRDRFNQDEEESEDGESEGQPEESTPRFETLRSRGRPRLEVLDGHATQFQEIEFDTLGGDVFRGELWLDRESGLPLRLTYRANTPFFLSVDTDSYFRQNNGLLERDSLEIRFQFGALFLMRRYLMRIEF